MKNANEILIDDLQKMNDQIQIVPHANLNEFKKEFRFTLQAGVASKTFSDTFFTNSHGQAIFKTYDNWGYKHIKNIRMLNELLIEKMLAQVGIPCVKYVPAKYIDSQGITHTGLITYNVLSGHQDFRHIATLLGRYDKLSLHEIKSRIESRKDIVSYSVDTQRTIKQLFAIEVFDLLTAQGDRGVSNVNFVHDKSKQTCSLDFVFDNELAYFSVLFTKPELECNVYRSLQDLLTDYSQGARFLTPSGEAYTETTLENAFRDIAYISKRKPEFFEITNHILANLDPMQAIASLEKSGHTIPDSYKNLVEKTHSYMTNTLQSFLSNEDYALIANETLEKI